MYLTDFEIQKPPFSHSQFESLKLLASLHDDEEEEQKEDLKKRIDRVCCKEDKINRRNTVIKAEWLNQTRGFGDRSRAFQHFAEEIFSKFYPESAHSPSELIHVTCTGYRSPSAAQKIILKRGWEDKTVVTHAYHMGCMAAVPAIRMALGSASLGRSRIDIVHTELCSLHFNPGLHDDDQLVAQSLFADGMIKYSLQHQPTERRALRVLMIDEVLIPNSEEKMKWECEDWGLKMTLAKEIPFLIGRSITNFIQRLEEKSGICLSNAYYAIHPGGPKIIEIIGKKLNLTKRQLECSEKILYNFGNMSSATLPHIWDEMLKDDRIPARSHIISLAFGPGICIAGAVLQKV